MCIRDRPGEDADEDEAADEDSNEDEVADEDGNEDEAAGEDENQGEDEPADNEDEEVHDDEAVDADDEAADEDKAADKLEAANDETSKSAEEAAPNTGAGLTEGDEPDLRAYLPSGSPDDEDAAESSDVRSYFSSSSSEGEVEIDIARPQSPEQIDPDLERPVSPEQIDPDLERPVSPEQIDPDQIWHTEAEAPTDGLSEAEREIITARVRREKAMRWYNAHPSPSPVYSSGSDVYFISGSRSEKREKREQDERREKRSRGDRGGPRRPSGLRATSRVDVSSTEASQQGALPPSSEGLAEEPSDEHEPANEASPASSPMYISSSGIDWADDDDDVAFVEEIRRNSTASNGGGIDQSNLEQMAQHSTDDVDVLYTADGQNVLEVAAGVCEPDPASEGLDEPPTGVADEGNEPQGAEDVDAADIVEEPNTSDDADGDHQPEPTDERVDEPAPEVQRYTPAITDISINDLLGRGRGRGRRRHLLETTSERVRPLSPPYDNPETDAASAESSETQVNVEDEAESAGTHAESEPAKDDTSPTSSEGSSVESTTGMTQKQGLAFSEAYQEDLLKNLIKQRSYLKDTMKGHPKVDRLPEKPEDRIELLEAKVHRYRDFKRQHEELNIQHQGACNYVDHLEHSMSERTRALDQMKQALRRAEQERDAFEKWADSNNELAECERRRREAAAEETKKETDSGTPTDQTASLPADSELQDRLSQCHEHGQRLKAEFADLQVYIRQLQAENGETGRALKFARQEFDKEQEEREADLRAKLERLQESASPETVDQLVFQLAERQTAVQELMEQLESQDEMERIQAKLRDEIAQLKAEKEQVVGERDECQESREEQQAIELSLRCELERLQQVADEALARADEASKHVESVTSPAFDVQASSDEQQLPPPSDNAPPVESAIRSTAFPRQRHWDQREAEIRNNAAYQQTRNALLARRERQESDHGDASTNHWNLRRVLYRQMCGWEEIPYVHEKERMLALKGSVRAATLGRRR